MLKVASVFAVQASAQYHYTGMPAHSVYAQTYQDVAHTFEDVYAPPLLQPMYGNQLGGQPIYNEPQYTTYPQPVMLQPQYVTYDGAFAQPAVPHPDEVKIEQANYLQQAQENLDKQKQAQKDELQQEIERITKELQRQSDEAIKGAEQRYEERLANLDRNAKEYTTRLDAQTNELKVKYFQNQAQDRFAATEATIAQQERFAQEQFQQAFRSGMGNPAHHQVHQEMLSSSVQKVQAERQENLRQLQQDYTLIGSEALIVNCGAHHARSCDLCPEGRGEAFCHGECMWSNGACVLQGGIPAAKEALAKEALAEEPLAEEPPAEEPPAEEAPAEEAPAEEPLAEAPLVEAPPAEAPPAEEVAEASPEEDLN